MIKIEQSQDLQDNQCNSNPLQLSVAAESSKGLVIPQDNLIPTIEYSEGNPKLTIRLGTIIIKKIKHAKMKNAKVYSNDQSRKEQNLVNQSVEMKNMIFSVKDYIQELSKTVQVISIENSRINIYALKKIVRITSKHLTNLRIENCTFYESDNSAIFEKDQSSNNKMLRELNFAFQTKALFLPKIDNIELLLKKCSSEDNNANSLECKDTIEEAAKEQKKRDDLVKEYDCHQESYFIEFEMNLKSTYEKKYLINDDQEKENKLIQYILQGNMDNKYQIEDIINDNIVRDINDHVYAFKKYLKGSLLSNNSIFIIKEYSLEDPIVSNMIFNMINRHHKKIKTIIFKQTGTIQFDSFRKVIDCMLSVRNLESVAFFDSQLQSNCYALLRELLDLKSFKYFVLNRSFFDIAVYKENVLGIEMIKDKEYQCITFTTPPKHYAFYLLDKANMLEFTPYKPFMNDLFLEKRPNPEKLKEYDYSEQYQFELLIQDQEKYDSNIQSEIKKYENKDILVFGNIESEQILVKYRDKLRNNNEQQLDQFELENDINTLIKHPSPYTIGLVHVMIFQLRDLTLLNNFLKTYKLLYSFDFLDKAKEDFRYQSIKKVNELEKQKITSSEFVVNSFLFEQGLIPCNRPCFLLENWFLNLNAISPLKIKKTIITHNYENYLPDVTFPLNPDGIHQLSSSKYLKGFILSFDNNDFNLHKILNTEERIDNEPMFKHSNHNGIQEFLKSTLFSLLLKDLKTLQQNRNDLEIQTVIELKSNANLLIPIYFQTLSEIGILELKRLQICCPVKELLTTSLPIKVLQIQFQNMEILNNLFEGQKSFEDVKFYNCRIDESFNINNFKDIRTLTFENCYLNCDQFFKNLKEGFESFNDRPIISSSNNKRNLLINITVPANSELTEDSEVSLNKDTVSYIMENQSRFRFKITNLDQKTISEISSISGIFSGDFIQSKYQPFINEILGMKIRNHFTSVESQLVSNSNSNKFKNHKKEQKNNDRQRVDRIRNQRLQQIQKICKQPGKMQVENISINQFIKNQQNKDSVFDYLPKCCAEVLNNYSSSQFYKESQNLQKFIEGHLIDSEEFCLFKTSIYQDMHFPKKIKINFQSNLLTNDIIVFSFDELNYIEELHFQNSRFSNISYLKFIDFIIQSAPNLKSLKFSSINNMDSKEKEVESFQISIGNHHPNLKRLSIKGNSFFGFFKSIVIKSEFIQLDQITMNLKDEQQNQLIHCEQNMKLIIDQAKDSLCFLNILNFSTEIRDAILRCASLRKLKILLKNEKQFEELNEILRIQSLEEIIIYTDSYIVSYSDFENLLKTSQEEQSHLKMISLKAYNSIDDISTCYRNQSYQILQIRNQFELLGKEEDRDNQVLKKSLSLEEYLTRYNNNISKSFDHHILHYKSNLTLIPLVQLYLDKSFDFSLLNQVFEFSRDSLELLSFNNCELYDNSLNSVDFQKLPNTIKYLSFDENRQITTLAFLKPLVSCRDSRYQKITLSLRETFLFWSEILVYYHFFKKIKKEKGSHIEFFNLLLKYLYKNDNQKWVVTMDCVFKANLTDLSTIEFQSFYQMIFEQRIEENKFPLFCLSPLQITSSCFDYRSSLIDLQNQQFEFKDNMNEKHLGNKLLLYIARFLKEDQKYLFGFRKNYYGSDFYGNKSQMQGSFLEKDKLHDQDFYDYLLLIQIQDKSSLKYIQLPLSLLVSFEMMHQYYLDINISEEEMIEYLGRIPASEITLEDMSIQFIKIWYVINSISSLTFKTALKNIDPDVIYNTSIGNYLTQNLHRNNFFRRLLRGSPNKYRFDETVHLLAQHFEGEIKSRKNQYLLVFFPLYLFVCIFGVIFFSLHFNVSCGEGISWYSYITYAIYGIITFYFELLLFKRCLSFISHLIPSLEIDLNPNFIISFVNFIKQSIIDTPWINQWYMGYSYSFFQSQIQRFDNFTNVGFLYSTFECGNYVIFSIALAFMIIPFLYSVYQFKKLITKPTKKLELPTSSLDTYYRICSLIEFRAVSDILDLVSPSNVICLRGRLFNARIINFFIRIVCESMPLVIIQIYNLTQKEMTSSLVLSLILSIITFLSMLMSVLTITPSTLNQEDFTQLNEKKIKNDTIGKYEERLQRVEDETFALRFYKHLKKIRSKYLKEKQSGNVSYDVAIMNKINKKYFESFFDQPMIPRTYEIDEKEIE